jgi:hypothetical protein
VPVREEHDISLLAARSCDDPISAVTHLLRSFPAWTTIVEEQPSWSLLANLTRGQSLEFTVIPLHQITLDVSALAEAS